MYALYTYVALLQLEATIMHMHVHMGEVVIIAYILCFALLYYMYSTYDTVLLSVCIYMNAHILCACVCSWGAGIHITLIY